LLISNISTLASGYRRDKYDAVAVRKLCIPCSKRVVDGHSQVAAVRRKIVPCIQFGPQLGGRRGAGAD
jgi:hypothetical protein